MTEQNSQIIDSFYDPILKKLASYLWKQSNDFLQINYADNQYTLNLVDISEIAETVFTHNIITNVQKDIAFLKQNQSFNQNVCKVVIRCYCRPHYSLLTRKLIKLLQSVTGFEIVEESQSFKLLSDPVKEFSYSIVEGWLDNLISTISDSFLEDEKQDNLLEYHSLHSKLQEQEELISNLKMKEVSQQLLIDELEKANEKFRENDNDNEEIINYIRKITTDTELLVQAKKETESSLKNELSNAESEIYDLSIHNSALDKKIVLLTSHKRKLTVACIVSVMTIIALSIALGSN